MAYNILNPSNIGTSTVEITVRRNIYAPEFVGSYSVIINENIALGTQIQKVSAVDEDGVSHL